MSIGECDAFPSGIFKEQRGDAVQAYFCADVLYDAVFPFVNKALDLESELLIKPGESEGNVMAFVFELLHEASSLSRFLGFG